MSWKPEYVILIIISTLVDYLSAIEISKTTNKIRKRSFLFLSLAANLGLLFAFKYFNFVSNSVRELLNLVSVDFSTPYLNVLLPVGISFYTFQTLSYTIDVYNGKIKPEKHLGIFAVYVSFFPQLVAGPIERAKNLLPQFIKKQKFDYYRVSNGIKLMLWGFFKKMVIADRLAVIVNTVYGNPDAYTGIPLMLATFFFCFQIYCDFSGYSDIAIGTSQILGIKLMDNFKRPYFSKSIGEFWKRWHISLSTWFRDYVYIPMGGNRVKIPRWYFNLFIVFLVSGFWHGANWTFVLWGALHGIYMISSHLTKKTREKTESIFNFPKPIKVGLKILFTFTLVNIGWILFRANSIKDAWYIITHLFTNITFDFSGISLGGGGWIEVILSLVSIAFLIFIEIIQSKTKIRNFLSEKPLLLRWGVYIIIILAIIFLGKNSSPFIYFQF